LIFFQKFITVINPLEYELYMATKPHLNMIVTGHIDNGKSTTMGHFLMDLGVVDERTIASHAAESEKTGKGDTFKYAWVMDNIKDERERGITIDLAFQKFESAKYFFTLIDAPGHRDFIKNMITGASEADAAILVLSAKEGETDTAIAAGGQAREHAFLLKTLGVGQLIVAINKMDDSKYSEEAFKAAKAKGEKLVQSVGYKLDKVPFIPVSGWIGDNLVKKSENMPWYTGKTLLEAFDDFTVAEKPIGKPLRVPIQD
jgi:elongation factor 1-alpha